MSNENAQLYNQGEGKSYLTPAEIVQAGGNPVVGIEFVTPNLVVTFADGTTQNIDIVP